MTEIVKKRYKPSVLSRDPYKRRLESEMIKIVTEVNSGMIGKRAACLKYGVNRNTWLYSSGNLQCVHWAMNYPLNFSLT